MNNVVIGLKKKRSELIGTHWINIKKNDKYIVTNIQIDCNNDLRCDYSIEYKYADNDQMDDVSFVRNENEFRKKFRPMQINQ